MHCSIDRNNQADPLCSIMPPAKVSIGDVVESNPAVNNKGPSLHHQINRKTIRPEGIDIPGITPLAASLYAHFQRDEVVERFFPNSLN
jgi:hypothetical protein